jgi:carnitine O-acetyltransferase
MLSLSGTTLTLFPLPTDLIAPHRIKFCIESKFSSPLTSTSKFKEYIADALLDMRAICEAGLNLAEQPTSKDRNKKQSVGGIEARVQARL